MRKTLHLGSLSAILAVFVLSTTITTKEAAANEPLHEEDRLLEYEKRGYQWPVQHFVPDTPGWRKLQEDRYAQIAAMESSSDRYSGYYQMVRSVMAPNFTEFGFGLARAPDDLLQTLRQGIYDGLSTAREEHHIPVIVAQDRPRFIDRPDLTDLVLDVMHPYVEAWAGIPLKAHQAYGFRLYQNNSQLMMHTDRSQTHVVSFILHIASSDNADPWPLFIEDYHGRTHAVTLTPGDVLFYESSKCNHGRPIPLNGDWYTSVFVHYYPDDGEWDTVDHELESHYAVPPHWDVRTIPEDVNDDDDEESRPRLVMNGMSFREPDCPSDWCRIQEAIRWSGPGVEGHWIAPNEDRIPLRVRHEENQPTTDEL